MVVISTAPPNEIIVPDSKFIIGTPIQCLLKRLFDRVPGEAHHVKFTGLPFDKDAHPITAVIHCTCDGEADSKTASKWSRALRYVAYSEVPSASLKTFMKEAGGINACAARFARYYGRGGR
jgi:hypothetical protein